MQRNRQNFGHYAFSAIVLFLILANIVTWVLFFSLQTKDFRLTFIDVGQGDAALIQTPDGYNILVDGGPNNRVSAFLDKALPINNRELDVVILTHPQSDHMFGLIEVIKKFKVKKIITSNVSHTTSDYKLWIDTVNNQDLKLSYLKAGESFTTADNVRFSFNWPDVSSAQTVDDLNKASLVFSVTYNDLDILMTGDADSQVQPYIGVNQEYEVLKVPHHGSKTALETSFLSQISPEVSIISAGAKNRYGHPRQELIKQLENIDSRIFKTGQSRNIKIVSDGQKWYTQTEN